MLGTISAFAYRHRETEKNLCRGGRSQDFPNTDWMDSSVSPKNEIWFLRVCHHISNAVYKWNLASSFVERLCWFELRHLCGCNWGLLYSVLGAFAKFVKIYYRLRHLCLSVCPHGTTRSPLDGFSWNSIFEYFSKKNSKNSSFIKIWQE